MNTRTRFVAATCVLLGVLGISAVSIAGSNITHEQNLTFDPGPIHQVGVDPNGPKRFVGDETIFRQGLLNSDGKLVAHVRAICVVVQESRSGVVRQCSLVFQLSGGDVDAEGLMTESISAQTLRVGVTGGTDRFENVRGSGEFSQTHVTPARWTLHLIP